MSSLQSLPVVQPSKVFGNQRDSQVKSKLWDRATMKANKTVNKCKLVRNHLEVSMLAYPFEILVLSTMLVAALPMLLTGHPTNLSVLLVFPEWFRWVWAGVGTTLAALMSFAMWQRRSIIVGMCNAFAGTLYLSKFLVVSVLSFSTPSEFLFPSIWYFFLVILCWWRANLLSRQFEKRAKIAGVTNDIELRFNSD